MGDSKKMKFNQSSDSPDMADLERKIRDFLYELNNKRDLLSKLSLAVQEMKMEKHDLECSLSKANRDLSELRIEADLAIKSARKGESDRASVRETLARQTVQIEIMTKERDTLQEQLRIKEVDNTKLRQQVEHSEQQMKSHTSFQEVCRTKQAKDHIALESLAKELVRLENDHSKLKRMSTAIVNMSQRAKFYVSRQRTILQESLAERNILQDKVNSLTGELDRLRIELIKKEPPDHHESAYLQNWVLAQEAMAVQNKEINDECLRLQTSLDLSIATLNRSQECQKEMEVKIKELEIELKNVTDRENRNMVDVEIQTDNNEVACSSSDDTTQN